MFDGRPAAAAPGETIWAVAARMGTEIPHLCHRPAPGYRPDGNCRACMVAVEGERALAASCVRRPAEGMVVTSAGARETRARAMVIEMLMADQPAEADAHDRSSRLLAAAATVGVAASRLPRMEPERVPLPDASHVAMRVNMDACIQCGLCVRACREVQVNDVIGMAGRGHDSWPVFDLADPMGDSTCVACGECVQACPTGALMEARLLDEAGRGDSAAFEAETRSVCPFCGVGCQVSVRTKGGEIVAVEGVDGPANEGRLCVKGRFGFDYLHHPHRLTAAADPARGRAQRSQRRSREPAHPLPRGVLGGGAGGRGRRARAVARRPRRARRRRLRLGQVHQRGGLSLPEADPAGLRAQQRRSLHAPVPRLLGRGPDGERRLRRGHGDLQRDRACRLRHRDRRQPGGEPPRRRDLLQAVRPRAAAS